MYGKGAQGLAGDMDVSVEEAQEVVDKYFEGKPSIRDFIERTHEQAKRDGYVDTLQGHRRLLKHIWNRDTENNALRQTVNTIRMYSRLR